MLQELNKYQLSLVVRLFLEPQQPLAYHPLDLLKGKACIHLQIYPIIIIMNKYSSHIDLNWNHSQNHLNKETEKI